MSYDNAEPKILKTLNSSGQVLDDSGNVISDTTDYWKKLYDESEPKPDKILHSDGTIKDSAVNVIQDSTLFNVKKYNQTEPIPAKYLHSDGTIDENPGSDGGADLEDNKTATIDVSTYTEPVEITPTAGKDGMKKATVTLSNIPESKVTIYGWVKNDDASVKLYTDFEIPPDNFSSHKCFFASASNPTVISMKSDITGSWSKNSDTEIKYRERSGGGGGSVTTTYVRASNNDLILW